MTTSRTARALSPWLRQFLTALLLTIPGIAAADSGRHLLPPVAGLIEAAVTRGGTLQLVEGRVEVSTARLKVCQGASDCADVVLSDPLAPCPGQVAGPWCVQFAGKAPGFSAQLQQSLGALGAEQVWQAGATQKAAPKSQPKVDAEHVWTWPLAAAWLLVPVLLGLGLRALARWRRKSRLWTALGLVGVLTAIAGVLYVFPVFGLWDFALAALLLLAAGLRTTAPAPASSARRLALIVLLLLLGGAELAARLWTTPQDYAAPPPRSALLAEDLEGAVSLSVDPTYVCYELFGSPTATEPAPHNRRIVLFLGDEAVSGNHIEQKYRVHTQLDLGADVTTVNRTVEGTSLDAQYLLAVRDIEHLKPELIVLFVNDANDLLEMDRHYGCCDGKTFLKLPPTGAPEPQCKEPSEYTPPDALTAWFLLSPAPYPLRVLASQSRALAVALQALDAARLQFAGVQTQSAETRLADYKRVLGDLKTLTAAQQVRLVVLGLPLRGHEREPRRADSVLNLARAAGLDVLDPTERFADAIRLGEPLYSYAWTGDTRIGEVGHYLLGKWLSPQLKMRLK